ncbi:MAG: NAD+ synthase [Candidatus Omnitrophica bacterium]|nr:NAD+ synthase [Candidatus Omnitrophota bacterium]
MPKINIALAQINPCVGDFPENYRKIAGALTEARRKKIDMVVFGELALCGYPPEDLLLKSHFAKTNLRYLEKISRHTKKMSVFIGFVDVQDDKIYNACAFIQDGKIKDIYHKVVLPNYGVFDEKRYFTPGDELVCYELDGFKCAVTICEDIWHQEVTAVLKEKGLDFIVNISSSPFHLGKISLREKVLSEAARKTKAFVLYCNLVGGQDELVFDGTSKVFSPQGKLIGHAKRFSEDFFTFRLDTDKNYPSKRLSIIEEKEAFCALKLGLFDYVRKNGFKKVIVGVSGGIDSALVVTLAVLSLGKENVAALLMPSKYTSRETFSDAQKVCRNLGIKYSIVPIDTIAGVYRNALESSSRWGLTVSDKTDENLQARIRGNILMAFSNRFGYLVLNTGNKSELSCGYCTLYGDLVGGFGILKDVPKMLVYKLARYINRIYKKKIIPESVLRRAPTAELKFNQRDQDTLPEYPLLDAILKLYVEENLSRDAIVAQGYKKDVVDKVVKMVDANEYKRRQAPVGIKITPRALGRDRRMPITNRFFT